MSAPRYFAWDDDVIVPFITDGPGMTNAGNRVVTATDALAMIASVGWHAQGRDDDYNAIHPREAVKSIRDMLAGLRPDGMVELPDYGIPECDAEGNDL